MTPGVVRSLENVYLEGSVVRVRKSESEYKGEKFHGTNSPTFILIHRVTRCLYTSKPRLFTTITIAFHKNGFFYAGFIQNAVMNIPKDFFGRVAKKPCQNF